jgi:hypothetical protein
MKCLNCESDKVTKLDDKHIHCPECKTTFLITKEGEATVDYDVPKRIEDIAKKVDEMYADHKARKEKNATTEKDPYEY